MFAKNYKLKESWKKGEKPKGNETKKKKRRRNLETLEFDPLINLTDPLKYETWLKENGKLEELNDFEQKKKGLVIIKKEEIKQEQDNNDDLEYSIKKGVVELFEDYFKYNSGAKITNIDDVKKVSTLRNLKSTFFTLKC